MQMVGKYAQRPKADAKRAWGRLLATDRAAIL
jgi:hypothetical protein